MMGTESSYFFLQQGLKLQLNKQLSTYLEFYKKTYPGLNPCCLTQDPAKAVDVSEKVPGINFYPSSAAAKVIVAKVPNFKLKAYDCVSDPNGSSLLEIFCNISVALSFFYHPLPLR